MRRWMKRIGIICLIPMVLVILISILLYMAVADVHKNFTADMMNAATAKGEDRSAMIDKAVLKDLKYMHVILDNSQYRKYVMLLNTTLINRGLK